MSEPTLVFEEPKQRKKPPSHFADFTPEERRAKVEELGLPGYRANQISTHYFIHYDDDPESWSDFPAAARTLVRENLLPPLITLVRSITCDEGMTRKDLWRLHDGVLVESVLMRYPERTTVCISSQAGWNELSILCHRTSGPHQKSFCRRNYRTDSCCRSSM